MINKLRRKNGLTLVESLFSVILLTTTLCLVLGALGVARKSVMNVRHRMAARNIIRARMEELKNTPYMSVVTGAPENVTIDFGFDQVEGTPDDLLGSREVTVTDMNGYKEITVTVFWLERGWGTSQMVSERAVTFISAWSIYQ